MTTPAPPRLAERLLRRCLGSVPASEAIVGDLRQEYAGAVRRRGATVARVWYWWEAAGIGLGYVAERIAPTVVGRDLLAGFRVFRTSPAFAGAVVLTLAFGIGVNATMFGAVDRVLLSPPEHVQDHETLRFLYLSGLGARSLNAPLAYSFPDYEAIRDLPVLAGAAAYRPRRQVTMGSGLEARRPLVQDATSEFFPLLGVVPQHGRFFDGGDDRDGAPPVAVLSHGFWEREFGGDVGVIGTAITLGFHTYEVIGVAPRGFTGANLDQVDVWVPLRMNVPLTSNWGVLESRGAAWHRVVVRLADGVTDDEAEEQLTATHTSAVAAAMEVGPPEDHDDSVGATIHTGSLMTALGPFAETETAITLWLAGVSLLVLLIACANVANLMLARGLDRQRERAVRLALGVGRGRLLTQSLGEALILAATGGLAAMVIARWSGVALYEVLLPGIPLPDAIVSLRLMGFLMLMVVATTVLAGALPALQAVRTAPGDVLRRARTSGAQGRARELLTLGQVALSTVLLIGAGLFVASLQNAQRVDLGFDQEALVNVEFEGQAGLDADRRDALYREALEIVSAMPEVERAVLAPTPRSLYGWDEMHDLRASSTDSFPTVPEGGPYTYAGTEGFVETAGLRVVRGRTFEPSEYDLGAAPAVMVSRSLAEGVWPGMDPLDECIVLREGPVELGGPEPCRPVVGVYEDIKRSITDRTSWSVLWPHPVEAGGLRGMLLRASGDPAALAGAVRERVAAVSSEIRYVHVVPMNGRTDAWRGPWRMGATLFSIFGALALAVAALGLYSVLAFSVARRRREIGIRAALGARRSNLAVMVVGRAARLIAMGLILGILVALVAGRFLEAVLFGVPTVSVPVFGAVVVLLGSVGLLAACVPAWRAIAVDPVGAIAAE